MYWQWSHKEMDGLESNLESDTMKLHNSLEDRVRNTEQLQTMPWLLAWLFGQILINSWKLKIKDIRFCDAA